jgi:stalled ribosome rescue protein Dom34
MAMNRNKIDMEIGKTTSLLREIKKVDSDPYLYDKVMVRIAEQNNKGSYGLNSIKMKIGFALITVLILFNLVSSVYVYDQAQSIEQDTAYQDFSQDLNINGNDDVYSQL